MKKAALLPLLISATLVGASAALDGRRPSIISAPQNLGKVIGPAGTAYQGVSTLGKSSGRGTKGAHGGNGSRRKQKDAFISQSCAEAQRIARERQHKREIARWFASLTAEEQAFAREKGLHEHLPTGMTFGPVSGAGTEEGESEFADAAESMAASVVVHPVDAMEPEGSGVEIPQLSDEEIKAASSTFENALRWALEGADLVEMGARSAVMVGSLRPDLAAGVPLDDELRDRFFKRVGGDYEATGAVFGRALEWARRGSSLSGLGERLYLVAYVLRPQLINAMTLARIGEVTNKTRQAKDRLANDLRDVFSGLKARTMRSDSTRRKCREAQGKR